MARTTRLSATFGPALALLIAVAAALAPATAVPASSDEIERRVEELLGRMTLAEKVGQLVLVSNGPLYRPEQVPQGRVGAGINFNNAQDVAAAQKLARQSRLGIPLIFGLDILHGFRTIFPVPLAETATFNPALARLAAEWSAREAAYVGVQWTYAPMADVARDPRWGRIVEGAGEDPYLARVFTAARVEGLHAGGLATGVKHFAGYGAASGGRDYDATDIPPTELRDTFLPPFRAAVDAGSETVMSAFNALNGVPATANPWLLTQVLRNEWGFSGFVVSDWAAIEELIAHGIAADGAEAARKAFLAGVDMDLAGGLYDAHLADEVRSGRIPESAVDEAVRRVLRVKFRMGLFERPDIDPTRVDAVFPTQESREVARAVARESLVLLHNRDEALPLRPRIRSLAVVGALAASAKDQLGPHAARGHIEDTVTILDGIRWRAEQAGVAVAYAEGCSLRCETPDGFSAAVEAARGADAVIAVLGEPESMSGEAASRAHLWLVGRQGELLDALAATGRPVVVVLVAGRPLELQRVLDKAQAVLMAWYPGIEGGPAVAEALFGDFSPSGKLPITWPRTSGQIPIHYNRLPTGRPTSPHNRFTLNYADESIEPLFPFGFGLSYTRFRFSGLQVAAPRLTASDTLDVRVTLTNVGERAGAEVAQLYVRDPVASRSRPVRELKAFQKVFLQPDESRAVTLRVPVKELGFHLEDGTYVVEAGRFDLFVGASARADRAASVEVTDSLRIPPGQREASRTSGRN
ncbi:MAG TPA: glycoside hydrolase family 3 N-terminal domain-containing protein [Beijerinckiaceae bacterium]|jgi:beta-glucosidase